MLLIGGGTLALLRVGSVSPDAPPVSAFDLPLQALKNQTNAPIMLPAELPDELKNVAVDADLEGDSYGLLFETTPPDELIESFVHYRTVGTFTAVPESETGTAKYFRASSLENVRLPDGTEAKLRHMEPVGVSNYGPYWEGRFDKNGYAYTLTIYLDQNGKSISEQVLSSMVSVER